MKYDLIFLYRFNNYYNRKVIFYNTLSSYLNFEYLEIENSNFNPSDGITTAHILNADKLEIDDDETAPEFDNIPDYLILLDAETKSIMSRWFVLNATRTTGNQYNLALRRDVIADHFETLKDSPIYVNKAHLKDTDPMILNDEGLTFNQIKKDEELLKDESGTAWIVGYMANDAATSGSVQGSTPTGTTYTLAQIAADIGGNMTEAALRSAINGQIEFNADNTLQLTFAWGGYTSGILERKPINMFATSDLTFTTEDYPFPTYIWDGPIGATNDPTPIISYYKTWLNANKATVQTLIENKIGASYYNTTQYNKLMAYNGKIILDGGKYYYLSIDIKGKTRKYFNDLSNNYLNALTNSAGWSVIYNNGLYYFEYNSVAVELKRTEILDGTYTFKIDGAHNVLDDAPYSIFMIQYNNTGFATSQGLQPVIDGPGGEISLAIANEIVKNLGTKLYDIQLLPFCPVDFNTIYNLDNLTEGKDYDFIKKGADFAGAIIYPKKSNFSKFISKSLSVKTSLKVDSQCRFYRICSPNYNGVFEFNLAKNGGSISGFYVDGTYKPYSPYIRIAPEFNLLYGANYHDGRGLICAGDFSLPIMNSAWENYQIQNKNYANIFNREIQNLDVMQRQEKLLQAIQAGAGIVTGGVAGAVAGAKAGPYGAIAGAILGTGAGIAGGIVDVELGNERRKEARDYAIDRFNLSLANIKALPDSLIKNSAFTINNKVFPFIEFYEPTEEEIKALENKIIYDGMTVNRIDKLVNFYEAGNPHYFKGQLIRFESDINPSKRIDSNQVNAIMDELLKGVYI